MNAGINPNEIVNFIILKINLDIMELFLIEWPEHSRKIHSGYLKCSFKRQCG